MQFQFPEVWTLTKTLSEELTKAVKPRPSWHRVLVARESQTRLASLLKEGMKVPANVGRAVLVTFKQLGDIVSVPNTGWKTVRLRSNFGGTSVLLFEEHEARRVSGLLRLKR